MPYRLLDDTDIQDWDTDYHTAAQALDGEADEAERAKLTSRMQSLGTQVEEHLHQVGRQIRAYFAQHSGKVDNWVRLSEQAIKQARKAADAHKKNPTGGAPAQIQQAADDMTLWAQAITSDAHDFGSAWFKYRNNVATHLPEKYLAAFKAARAKVMEDQKAITIKHAKIKGYAAEAQGLLKVVAKATMKAGIKAGTGVQRDLALAQQDARDLAAQMAVELDELRTPRGLATQPAAITNAMQMAKADAKDKTFTKTPGNAAAVAARKKTFESGIKLMRTKAAAMEKLLAAKTKGFRKGELNDPTVRAEIKKANQCLKDALADLKISEAETKKGREAIAAIEARWAAKAKKK